MDRPATRTVIHTEPGLRIVDRSDADDARLLIESDPLEGAAGATHARYAIQDVRKLVNERMLPETDTGVVRGCGKRVVISGKGLVKRFAEALADKAAVTGSRGEMRPVATRILAAVGRRERQARRQTLQAPAQRQRMAMEAAVVQTPPVQASAVLPVADDLSPAAPQPAAPGGQMIIAGFESLVPASQATAASPAPRPVIQVHQAIKPVVDHPAQNILPEVVPYKQQTQVGLQPLLA